MVKIYSVIGIESNSLFYSELNEDHPPILKQVIDELPSQNQIEMAREYFMTLSNLKITRNESIANYKLEAKQFLEKLRDFKTTNIELIHSDLQPTAENVQKLQLLVEEMSAYCNEREEKYHDMKKDLQLTWKYLDIPSSYKELFLLELSENPFDKSAHQKLELELNRCTRLKLARIPDLIERFREDIILYSEKCKKSEDFRKRSVISAVFITNEKILQRHEAELRSLKMFYRENEEIFTLLEKRVDLKAQMEELQRKQEDVKDRLKNRGGRLLKEENERKTLERKILKVEADLSKAVEDFQMKNQAPFLVNGVAVELDEAAKSKIAIKKQTSSTNLRLIKKPFGDLTNK